MITNILKISVIIILLYCREAETEVLFGDELSNLNSKAVAVPQVLVGAAEIWLYFFLSNIHYPVHYFTDR